MANLFNKLINELGGSAPDDSAKNNQAEGKDTTPKGNPKDASKDTSKDVPKDDAAKTDPKDAPEDTSQNNPQGNDSSSPAPNTPKDDKTGAQDIPTLDAVLAATSDDSTSGIETDDAKKPTDNSETMSSNIGNVGAQIYPLNPNLSKKGGKRNMKMRDRDFYDRIGDLAYYHDRGDDGDYSELDTYMKEYKAESLSETDLIKEIDAALEADYDRFSAVLLNRIANAEAHRPDPVRRLFVNKIDKNDTTEYETFDQALASVKDNPYVTDPKTVFEQIYRQVKDDGSLGDKVSEQEVRKYADTLNAKNKTTFLNRMGLPEQKPQTHQNQQKGSGKPDKGKKDNRSVKPKNADNSAGGNASN